MQKIFFALLFVAIMAVAITPLVYGVNSSEDYDKTVPGHKKQGSTGKAACGDQLCDREFQSTVGLILSSNT